MDSMILHRKSSEQYANDNVFEYACAKGKVSSLGYGFLAEPALPKFKLDGDETTERIKVFLEGYLVPPKHIVFSTASLNIVINHLISHPCYIVEVEKDYLLPVFDELKTTMSNNVLLNPTEKALHTYWKSGTILLRPLATKAPIASDGSYRIEKLIVDLILSWQIQAFYSGADIEQALDLLCNHYEVNFHTLFAYAKRKGKAKQVFKAIQDLLKEPYQEVIHAIKEKL